MRTTVRILTGWVAAAVSLSAGIALAVPLEGTTSIVVGTASVAQVAPLDARSGNDRQQAADLLRRARQEMAEDDLEAAESLISAAEALGVKYNVLHLGDTPKKARRDLQRKRTASKASPVPPSKLFSQFSLKKKQTARTDPFSRWPSDSEDTESLPSATNLSQRPTWLLAANPQQNMPMPDLDFTNPVRLPSVDQTKPMPSPFDRTTAGSMARYPETQPIAKYAQTRSSADLAPNQDGPLDGSRAVDFAAGQQFLAEPVKNSLRAGSNDGDALLEARRAIALGDVKRATSFVERAKQQPQSRRPLDDTPEQVEAAIQEFESLSAQPKNTETYRRAYARMLMGQSEALLRAADYNLAEELAHRASRQRLAYGPFEAKPDDLLKQIATARRQAEQATTSLAVSAKSPGMPIPSLAAKNRAEEWTRRARVALNSGQLDWAETLALRGEQLGVPDSVYALAEDRPELVLLDIRKARHATSPGMTDPNGHPVTPAIGTLPAEHTASFAVHDSSNDPTRNVRAVYQQPASSAGELPAGPRRLDLDAEGPVASMAQSLPTPVESADAPAGGLSLFRQGEAALKAHDRERAYHYFKQAATQADQLDPGTAQALQGYLQSLSAPPENAPPGGPPSSAISATADRQKLLTRQVAEVVIQDSATARAMLSRDPKGAMAVLEETRGKVNAAGLEPDNRARLLRRIDDHLDEIRQFIEQNRPRIELDEKNRQTRDEIDRRGRLKVEIQEKLALMVDDFNRKMDEQRWEDAEVIAKRAAELDPENPLIKQLLWQSKFVRRFAKNQALLTAKEEGFYDQLDSVAWSARGFDDRRPYRFTEDLQYWEDLTRRRGKSHGEKRRQRTEKELEIEHKLRTPVSLHFTDEPLSNVLDHLAELTGISMHLDSQALAEYAVPSDTPVSIELRSEIMLKSALNLILEPLQLSYIIKDEVLKITSEQQRDGEIYVETYFVGDLVMPVPNFKASPRMGLAGAYHDAMGNIGFGGIPSMATPPMAVVASKNGNQSNGMINPALLAQMSGPGAGAGGISSMPMGFGPGGLGGGSQADFDSLIELITTTIKPQTWEDTGGPGSIKEFSTNLSLVVSQTQDVHEEIVDLLEQLRRLQDLQVTIEVKFLTLNDNFFERIGVDFDFDIDDNIDRPFQVFGRADQSQSTAYQQTPFTANSGPNRNVLDTDGGGSVAVGMEAPGVFSADLDIPFLQNSFGLAVPQFGGFAADAGAQLGFAILSDIEAFFFINAAQGDRRSNVLQAPKVTLFNGQQAFVSDTSQSPFVISVVPVVGDFAAAQQPVIVVLSEGTFMTVQAVISNDRRFVRLTVVPFFSKIGDVNTFQFTGSQTTTTDTSAEGIQNDPNDNSKNANSSTTTSSGTTVQLPTFSFVTVTTTVSVPDGGTVLLGGIKRLSEGRNEFGVPILNKVPYLNRLFKNVGIGRETQSLMMMVTPRIIIQEEEEQRLGIQAPP